MGASSSCQILEKLSSVFQWTMVHKYKAGGMFHLIDDLFFIGPAGTNNCLRNIKKFEILCGKIGIPIKETKTVWQTTILTIYGIEKDTNVMQNRPPKEKLVKLKHQLYDCVHKRKIKLKELQSLIGLLNFACMVV